MIHARDDYNRIQDPAGKIPADEPVFLLRAQDELACQAVEYYAYLCGKAQAPDVAAKAWGHAEKMRAWPTKKVPDLPDAAAPAPVAQGDMRAAELFSELAGTWVAMTANEPNKSRRETLRECADGLEMLAGMVRQSPAAPAPVAAPMIGACQQCGHEHEIPAAPAPVSQPAWAASVPVGVLTAAPAPVLTPAQQRADDLLEVLKAGRNDLALAAASWHEDENRQVADFHRERVLALVKRVDAVFAAIEATGQEGAGNG